MTKMKDKTKGILIGLALGLIISCNDNVMADNETQNQFDQIGSVAWNPLYVKIVE